MQGCLSHINAIHQGSNSPLARHKQFHSLGVATHTLSARIHETLIWVGANLHLQHLVRGPRWLFPRLRRRRGDDEADKWARLSPAPLQTFKSSRWGRALCVAVDPPTASHFHLGVIWQIVQVYRFHLYPPFESLNSQMERAQTRRRVTSTGELRV